MPFFIRRRRIELDNNSIERTIRPIALNRKNALFAGHEAGAHNWGYATVELRFEDAVYMPE